MNTKNLDEVSFIRPILIFLLVFFHAFIIFDGGGWDPVNGVNSIVGYKWLDRLSYSFMLETFVFISGYLFAFQFFEKKIQGLYSLVKKKFARLLLPCWVFGIIYLASFGFDGNLAQTFIYIIGGAGHLWFLPMLFWCFIGGEIIARFNLVKTLMLPILIIVALLSYNPLPLQLSSSMYYILFFFLGMLAFNRKEQIMVFIDKIKTWNICAFWLFFGVLFVFGTMLNDVLVAEKQQYDQALVRLVIQMCIILVKVVYSSIGTMCLYITALSYTRKHILSKQYIAFGSYCFSVYIFQQFILKYLYYHTSLALQVGSVLLPIIGFFIAFSLSYLLARVIRTL